MFKKIMVISMVVLASGIIMAGNVCAQMQQKAVNNNGEGFIMYQYVSLAPINNFLQTLSCGPFDDNITYYGFSYKSSAKGNFYCGVMGVTTLGGLDILEPGCLSREKTQAGSGANNLAELSMTFGEVNFEYRFLKVENFYVSAGCGLGLGGAKLTVFGDNGNGRFGMLSMLVDPKVSAGYIFTGKNDSPCLVVNFTSGYNYFPGCSNGWWKDAGSIAALPKVFDMSGWYMKIGVGMPFAANDGEGRCPAKMGTL